MREVATAIATAWPTFRRSKSISCRGGSIFMFKVSIFMFKALVVNTHELRLAFSEILGATTKVWATCINVHRTRRENLFMEKYRAKLTGGFRSRGLEV